MNILEQRGGGFLLVLRSAPFPRLRVPVPLFGAGVCAGFPSPADDHIEEIIDLNELLVRNPPATFYIRAVGVSMIRVGIMDGDILVVDRSEDRLATVTLWWPVWITSSTSKRCGSKERGNPPRLAGAGKRGFPAGRNRERTRLQDLGRGAGKGGAVRSVPPRGENPLEPCSPWSIATRSIAAASGFFSPACKASRRCALEQ